MKLDPRQQEDLTVVVRVRKGQHEKLSEILEALDDVVGDSESAFGRLTTTHFMRWVVIPPLEDGPWQLALSTNYDPPRERHVGELLSCFGPKLHEIYSHCEGYPSNPTVDTVGRYFKKHKVVSEAFYSGHACRTRQQIIEEAKLRDDLEAACDQVDVEGQGWAGMECGELRERMREVAESRRDAALVGFVPKRVARARIRMYGSIVFWGLLALLMVPFFAIPLLIKERLDARKDAENAKESFEEGHDPERRRTLLDREDLVVQNQLTHLVPIKKGISRQIALRITLRLVNGLARYCFNKGDLNGIPTIHFARWCIIDGGKRLLFFSNYDGSWESYLGDFVDQAADGLTGIWSNTERFPKTRFLILGGARDEEQFKNWARAHQVRTQVWYSAYRNLSVRNINHNTELRRGLVARPKNDEALKAWSKLL